MNYHVVTTCNRKGWEETGRRMAASFRKHWPLHSLPLMVYAEDFDPDIIDCVEVRRLPAWLAHFKQVYGSVSVANGMVDGRYTYTHDAVKFAHKVAALTDFAENLTSGVVIWLDADTFTHSDVTEEWLDGLFPEPAYIAWLDRLNTHPECGLVMFRASHPYHGNFMQAFRNLYTSGDLFRLAETHDSFALQHLVRAKVGNGKIPPPASLSGEARRTSHVLINSRIGEAMDHCKGSARKARGHSDRRDIVFPRSEPYWRELPR